VTLVDQPQTEYVSPPPERPNRQIPQMVGGGILVLIGVLWLLERTALIDLSVTAVLGIATALTGLALMVLAGRGAHGGLIVFGTILALVTLLTAAAPFEGFQGGIGDRTVEISSLDDIRPDYNLALGKLTLDLRQIDNADGAAQLRASVGMGELIVRVPAGTEVSVEAAAGAGQVEIFDGYADGVGISESYLSPGAEREDVLHLDLRIFAGKVVVTDE
jgi:hypothetical protein